MTEAEQCWWIVDIPSIIHLDPIEEPAGQPVFGNLRELDEAIMIR